MTNMNSVSITTAAGNRIAAVEYEPSEFQGWVIDTTYIRTLGLDGLSEEVESNDAGWLSNAPAEDHEWPNNGILWG